MIKATELRIGDLINRGMPSIVLAIDGRDELAWCNHRGTNYYVDLKRAEPIPLTEEWLLKFGFEHNKEIGFNILNEKLYKRIIIPFDRYNEVRIAMPHMNGIMTIAQNIKCVHQLQNLYFALTREELTIKEKALA